MYNRDENIPKLGNMGEHKPMTFGWTIAKIGTKKSGNENIRENLIFKLKD